ncbi:LLM class flavin-dependent oxidoreductase [Nakamurella flavida]|uniref:LLM class flavin-dependent oxidoreductase n=1 Tax=Nakamurella flavida TaxID=363630 RepID=A0A938YNX5_9ACTN|nr:LLM class flavin-dependent oxidoreductase [Nakamurella flavida]MBM9478203.1 LLM class flavin-dependent oxidoreductase [Nakamurella flavida]MDP9778575.1 alkanesulfonate monooxygenase SsuD/methylene tetrahydromethanopterin reductase-like flavin-dependent oxidoreductase (luciferase family) [Nakamurella flavida]
MTTLGVVHLPQNPPEKLREVARAADAAGLDELWLWEDCFLTGGVSTAAAILAWTERLGVGIGLLPVPLRNVALTAMELATLEAYFPGRTVPAVGHGVLDWMGQVGARAASPMTLLREYTTALQALLRGDTVTTDGRYVHLDGVALDWPPAAPPRLLVGATGPRTLQLAGELGEGTVLSSNTTPDEVRAARVEIDRGRATAGRGEPATIAVFVIAATGPDAAQRLDRELRRWNYDPARDIGIAGGADDVATAVRRWTDAGADTVVLQPTLDEPDVIGFVEFVAGQVAPLVR